MLELHDKQLLRADAFVDGKWVAADDGARFAVTNPSSGDRLVQVSDLGTAETGRAIAAALPA